MSKSEQLLRDDLDCLRLASDLTQLAATISSAALKAYILGSWPDFPAPPGLSAGDQALSQGGPAPSGHKFLASLSLASSGCIALHRG